MGGDEIDILKLVKRKVAELAEHVDAVQVFVSKDNRDSTSTMECGSGNWYARKGHVRSWLNANDEREREDVRKEDDE